MSGNPHFLYLEEKVGDMWLALGRVPCTCHISENHWKERP